MKKETELLEKQLTEQEDTAHQEKSMTDEQFSTVMEAITKISEAQAASDEKITTLAEQVVELGKVEEAEEQEKVELEIEDDSAKGGDNDQSGAEDEIDLDAELTPELEAQLEAELAEAA
ncbi:hypothetical protein LR392_04710 [Arthrobacter sp. AK04]|uniref:hypothetical protein n=1 Tax=Arthrobacter sp. AK04 TaxID=2900048 RepID=UPI001E5843E6|nr:hypothetical protein [Arthrobacter sp. AK04]MCD5341530.1 hypothetical protein [Arthrobacter sp. AK04]